MNDDELTDSLTRAMRAATAADEPSARLTQTLVRTRVAGTRRPYLVPLGATAVVTALTAGGFVVAGLQGSATSTAAGDATSATPAPTTAASAASSIPSVAATSAAAIVVVSESATPSAAPTATAAPITIAAPVAFDDSALFAQAFSYSVTEKWITDPTLADSSTKTRTFIYQHDDTKVFYANQQEAGWDDLAKLPTDVEAFRAAVKEPGHPPNAVEKGLQELLAKSPLPMPQRRAAMQVAMTMPGATVTKDAHDADGRAALRVSIETAWMDNSYYFDPLNYQLLEASSFVTPEWEAHWTPIDKTTGQPTSPLGSGYQALYSNWTITPKA